MRYGFNQALEIAQLSEKDWVFGGFSTPGIGDMPPVIRENYLPDGEVQRAIDDMMDCASRGPINILEAKFTYAYNKRLFKEENLQWLKDNGYLTYDRRITFSDAYVAINSGTTRAGNSLKAPLEAIRTKGLVPKRMLPLESWMTFDSYHDPARITRKLRDLGAEFKNRFQINYEQVYKIHFKDLLKDDFFDVCVYAWPEPVNGEYPQTTLPANHVVALVRPEYYVFDNYQEAPGDFIKKLAPDFAFWDYGYRIFIAKDLTKAEIAQLTTYLQKLVGLFKTMVGLLMK